MYTIFLTDSAKEEMQNKSLSDLEKISERLNFIQKGYWKNGTRVKKLRGLNKIPIFEARIDKANLNGFNSAYRYNKVLNSF